MSWSSITDTRLDSLLRELDVAIVERGLRINRRPYLLKIHEGTNIQSHGLYVRMQTAIEESFARFVNMSTGALNLAQDDFNFYDRTTFAAAAGLTYPDLWRRKMDANADFSYGQMQVGDIIGPWIIEDLQKALDAMTVFRMSTDYEDLMNAYKQASGKTEDEAAVAFASAEWKQADAGFVLSAFSRKHREFILYREVVGPLVCYRLEDLQQFPRIYASSGEIMSYIKGDAKKPNEIHPDRTEFDSFGDTGIVEGTNSAILRPGRVVEYPSGLTLVKEVGDSFYTIIPTGDSPPSFPSTEEYPVRGYKVPFKGYGYDVFTAQFLVRPNYTYG